MCFVTKTNLKNDNKHVYVIFRRTIRTIRFTKTSKQYHGSEPERTIRYILMCGSTSAFQKQVKCDVLISTKRQNKMFMYALKHAKPNSKSYADIIADIIASG